MPKQTAANIGFLNHRNIISTIPNGQRHRLAALLHLCKRENTSVSINHVTTDRVLTNFTVNAFCAGETRQHTTVSHWVPRFRNDGLMPGVNAWRSVPPSITTAKEAFAPETKPRSTVFDVGGPNMDAILLRPASICARVPSGLSADRIMISILLQEVAAETCMDDDKVQRGMQP